jgi:hypothetical protein
VACQGKANVGGNQIRREEGRVYDKMSGWWCDIVLDVYIPAHNVKQPLPTCEV